MSPARLFDDDTGNALEAVVAALVSETIVVDLEVVDIDHQHRDRAVGAVGQLPFLVEASVQCPAVRDAGQTILVCQKLEGGLRLLLHRDVAQRLHDRDERPVVGVDRPRVDREIATAPADREDAPVLGRQGAGWACHAVIRLVELGDARPRSLQNEVREALALLLVKSGPVKACPEDGRCRHTGHPFHRAVPDDDLSRRVQHEGGHDEMLHQLHGKVVVSTAADHRVHSNPPSFLRSRHIRAGRVNEG
jgi:hypothetical protein